MHIYIFRSQARVDLRAFAGDRSGSKLPTKFGPWHATGVIRPERDPPYRLSRTDIESAINAQGFQLWRMRPADKKEAEPAPA
jgi:hypothetical protein